LPLYEYRCQRCSMVFEKYQTDRERFPAREIACPRCGGNKTERVYSVFTSRRDGQVADSAGGCEPSGFS
jgi:putative FmdB family regulatory protein